MEMRSLEVGWAVAWRWLLAAERQPGKLVGALVRPALWLFFLGIGLRATSRVIDGMESTAFLFPGILLLAVLQGSLLQGMQIGQDRRRGFLAQLIMAPVSRVAVGGGIVLASALLTFAVSALLVPLAPLARVHLTLGRVGMVLATLAWLSWAFAAFGVLLAARGRSLADLGIPVNLVSYPMFLLSGGVFPVRQLAPWMLLVVKLNPAVYAVDVLRHALGQPTLVGASTSWAVIWGFGALCTGFAVVSFHGRRGPSPRPARQAA